MIEPEQKTANESKYILLTVTTQIYSTTKTTIKTTTHTQIERERVFSRLAKIGFHTKTGKWSKWNQIDFFKRCV